MLASLSSRSTGMTAKQPTVRAHRATAQVSNFAADRNLVMVTAPPFITITGNPA
jgi:hypothetical protein